MDQKYAYLYHVGFWLLFWGIQSILWSDGKFITFYLVKNIAIVSLQAGIVYFNILLLFPWFFQSRRYFLYLLLGVLLVYLVFITSFTWIDYMLYFFTNLIPGLPTMNFPSFKFKYSFWGFLSGSAPYSLAFLSSLVWKVYRENERHKSLAQQLSLEKAQTEIQYLRSQINPHFLFNSLNNIHLLILTNQKVAAKYTVLLSDLLRYMLYEVKKDKTTLKDEIQSLENYLDLMELKMENANAKSVSIDLVDNQLPIVPLVLISLVENGIKHSGIEYSDEGFLDLVIRGSTHQLDIKMKNSIGPFKPAPSSQPGIGMDNLKRRLELHYPGQYHFSFDLMDNTAITQLTLTLSE